MIANTQANPLSSLLAALNPVATSVMGSSAGTAQPRFDLTLLEMTKQVVDSTILADESNVVVPEKVKKALESVLNTLASQSPQDPAQAFSQDPAAVKVQNLVIDQAAGAGNLTISEHKQLNELVGMSVGKIQSSLQPVIALPKSLGESIRAIPVVNSGPKGGTTELTSVDSNDNSFTAPEPVAHKDEQDPARQLPQLAANVQAPMIVSTRTQVNSETNAENTTPVSGVAAQREISGSTPVQEPQAVLLTTQAPQPAEANKPAPQMTMPANSQPRVSTVVSSLTISPEPKENNLISNQTPKPVVSTKSSNVVEAPEAEQPSGPAPVQAPQQTVVLTPNTIEVAQVEILSSNAAPSSIVPGSEITLSDSRPILVPQLQIQAQASPPVTPAVIKLEIPELAQTRMPADIAQPVALAIQQTVAPVIVAAAPVVIDAVIPEATTEAAPVVAATFERQESQTISPMKRFMDETELRSSQSKGTPSAQAPLILTRESFKDLAASITREFSLRENVFQQAIAAIEDASHSTSQIRIVLKPESLGSMEVSLSMEGGKLTAKLIASSNEVRDIFAANLTQFKQALEAQGLQVNQLSVAVKADSNSQGQPQQWQQNQPSWQQAPVNDEAPAQSANPFAAFTAPLSYGGSSSTFNALA